MLLKLLFSLIVGVIGVVIIGLVCAGLLFLTKISVWYGVIAIVLIFSASIFKEIKDV